MSGSLRSDVFHFISRIVAASYDKTVKAWDLETGKLLVSLPCPVEASRHGPCWAVGSLGWTWGGKRAQASGREFSQRPQMMEGGCRGRKASCGSQKEGCLEGGKDGHTGRSGGGGRRNGVPGRGKCTGEKGEETLPCGVFALDEAGSSAEAMGQRPHGPIRRVLGPSQSVLHLGGSHHSLTQTTLRSCVSPAPRPKQPRPAQGPPQGLLSHGRHPLTSSSIASPLPSSSFLFLKNNLSS